MRTARMLGIAYLALCLELLTGREALPGEPTGFPQAARERYEQGRNLQKKGQLKEAVSAYDAAIRLGMQAYPRVHLYRADAARQLKEFDSAIAQYTQVIDRFGLEDSCRY
jgi:tetratricopeptide (TPR) repeat protein